MRLALILLVAAGAIVFIGIGFLFFRSPQPEIILPAEVITTVGPLNITNTLIAAWTAMLVLIVVSFFATRSMDLMPSGLQNFVEASLEFIYNQVVEIAGEENGRKFFAVCATFFLFILVANWMGLLPFFNAIGRTEDVGHEIFHEIEELHEHGEVLEEEHHFAGYRMQDAGGVGIIEPNATDMFEFEIHPEEAPTEALDRYIVALADWYTDTEFDGETIEHPTEADVTAAFEALEASDAVVFHFTDGDAGVPSPALGQTIEAIEFGDEKVALNIPIFRSAYSDANNTIALGIVSFLIVEFWGFQALGLGYLRKFFNFSSPIMAFVGILELISEFIRIISFAFRLLGNIFAGEVLILMLTFLVPFIAVDAIYGLELFVGFIQAAVFALLTLVFAVGAVEHHGEEHDEGHDASHSGAPAASEVH